MPTPETLGPRVALHLLNRAGYGPRPGEIASVLAQGPDEVDRGAARAGAGPRARLAARRLQRRSATRRRRCWALYNADNRTIGTILDEFLNAKVVRAAHARNQLQEVLVDFWFNHFNVFVDDGFDRYSISSYERDAIRPHVLGSFRELLGTATLHPAMLYYLDNYLSTVPRTQGGRPVGGINENHGRELLELHTVGVDAGYTQNDVVEASRCLTGHGIDNVGQSGNFVYRPANHDDGVEAGVRALGGIAGGGARTASGCSTTWPRTRRPRASSRSSSRSASSPTIRPRRSSSRLADGFLRTGGDLREVIEGALRQRRVLGRGVRARASPRPASSSWSARCARPAREVQNPRLVADGDPGRRACRSTRATRPPATATAAPTGSTRRRSSIA